MKTTADMTLRALLALGTAMTVYTSVSAQDPNLELRLEFDDEANIGLDSSGNGRDGVLDETALDPATWVNDPDRGGVIEFLGSTGDFMKAEIPELPGDNFTITVWAYRDPDLCCGAGGANDGLFQVALDADTPPTGGNQKVIGGWVQKSDAAVWGRVVDDFGTVMSLNNGTYFMEDEVWTHFAYRGDGSVFEIVVDGESGVGPSLDYDGVLDLHDVVFVGRQGTETWGGRLDDFRVYSRALTDEEIAAVMAGDENGGTQLRAGDADMDLDFDQLDLVKVQIAGKYLTGQPATWGDGDWDGAPGGAPGDPPPGDGQFNQLDIIAALNADTYLMGPYAALAGPGTQGDAQTSIVYNPGTGEVSVDAPAGTELTSINIDSASGIFTGDAAQNLGGSFDNDADNNIFKATFGSSFGSLSFGNVAQPGLAQDMVMNDLTVVGSLAGGGDLGNVDLIYIPEPASITLLGVAMLCMLAQAGRGKRVRA